MKKYKRIFLIVMDSVGVGNDPKAKLYDDEGANTLLHTIEANNGLNIPTLTKLGIGDLVDSKLINKVNHKHSYTAFLDEASVGKDTMTGHWEMMGIKTTSPFVTFTDTGFPLVLIKELEEKTGHKVIGNYAASGTEIIKQLGEEQMRDNSLIVYTSADSVLQIAAHEEVTGLEELYRCCDIAREICLRPEYKVGRIIARPFVGTNKDNFKRTSNRHDLALRPPVATVMNILDDNNVIVSCVGKIGDIFDGYGVSKTQKTTSNIHGMDVTIDEALNNDFKEGFCFVNLVEFDSEYGHRRDAKGYGKALEDFDKKLHDLVNIIKDDDLIIITADHGNDPIHKGSDHTRERVPFIAYSKSIEDGEFIGLRNSFADMGASILYNFSLNKSPELIGEPILQLFK